MFTLLSTVVAPKFADGSLVIAAVEITSDILAQVERNLCGHPVTDRVLREACPTLPPQEKGAFWDGSTPGLAIRPRGGVRGASTAGDTEVALDDLEAVTVTWWPAVAMKAEN